MNLWFAVITAICRQKQKQLAKDAPDIRVQEIQGIARYSEPHTQNQKCTADKNPTAVRQSVRYAGNKEEPSLRWQDIPGPQDLAPAGSQHPPWPLWDTWGSNLQSCARPAGISQTDASEKSKSTPCSSYSQDPPVEYAIRASPRPTGSPAMPGQFFPPASPVNRHLVASVRCEATCSRSPPLQASVHDLNSQGLKCEPVTSSRAAASDSCSVALLAACSRSVE